MKSLEYSQPVTRTEIFELSKDDLRKERQFQRGKTHRGKGLPCMSTNGAYLNGWYEPETEFYYIPKAAAHLL